MFTLQDLSDSFVLLSQLTDIVVATAASATVTITVGQLEVFDEKLYADADGKIYLRDVYSLLKPYMTATGIESITIEFEAGSSAGECEFSCMWCTAVVPNINDAEDVAKGNWLMASDMKTLAIDSDERAYVYSDAAQEVTVNALYTWLGEEQTHELTMTASAGISYVNLSPSNIIAELWQEVGEGEGEDISFIRLLGYSAKFGNDHGKAEMLYHVDYSRDESQLTHMQFRNQWGQMEYVTLPSVEQITPEYELTTAFVSGRMKALDTTMRKSNQVTISLLTDNEVQLAQILSATDSLKVRKDGTYHDAVITGVEIVTGTGAEQEQSAVISWEFADALHLEAKAKNGTDSERKFSDKFARKFE